METKHKNCKHWDRILGLAVCPLVGPSQRFDNRKGLGQDLCLETAICGKLESQPHIWCEMLWQWQEMLNVCGLCSVAGLMGETNESDGAN